MEAVRLTWALPSPAFLFLPPEPTLPWGEGWGERYREPSRVELPDTHFPFVRFVVEAVKHRVEAKKWKGFMRFLTASHRRCTI